MAAVLFLPKMSNIKPYETNSFNSCYRHKCREQIISPNYVAEP
nr:MAG TPA: hypothetical protein [Caudoviricetes sp.]